MGIENRDYMAGSSFRRPFAAAGGRSMVTTLIIVNVAVFFLQLVFQRPFEEFFALNLPDLLRGQIWRLGTYDFLHQREGQFPLHLLFNMWLLHLAGRRVEATYGSREFLAFYLVSAVLSGLFFIGWGVVTGRQAQVIGASGAAVAVMVVYALNWPQDRWYIWGILPMPVIVLAGIAALFDILPMINELASGQPAGRIAHAAHLGGMLFGFLYVRFRWRITGWFDGFDAGSLRKRFRRKPPLKVHAPELDDEFDEPTPRTIPPEVETRVDQLLEKIAVSGEASLSDEERRFLSDASRRYRQRR